jgi:phage/plasmid-like protein (TIGR03299 family)
MSRETSEWLNTQTLIGFTSKRGHAWHYKADAQGAEPNHYAEAVPVEDVQRRLFNWSALEGQLQGVALTDDGVITTSDPSRKVIMRSDTGAILGVFKSGYSVHQYGEWLIDSVANLLDDSLSIGSAGLLRGGAVAWVSVEVPENVTTPSGVEFRPHLIASTSHDGTLATTYKRSSTVVVCDNTLSAALGGAGEVFKVKHSRYSSMKLQSARDALAIIHTLADDFSAQVEALCATTVTDSQWRTFLDTLTPVPEQEGRARTMAENKRDALVRLWNHDQRVEPWKGTAFGVLQAVNTYEHHEAQVRGMDRADRNMLRAIKGEFDAVDAGTLGTLAGVLA